MREEGEENISLPPFSLAHCVFYYHSSELCQDQPLPKIAEKYQFITKPPSASQFETHCLLLGQRELLIFLKNMMDCS